MGWCSKYSSKARLDGKTAIVTGSNTGIGKYTALDFVKRGAHVIMACRDMGKAEKAAEEIRGMAEGVEGNGTVEVVCLNLGSIASVRQCAQEILQKHEQIHLLVDNAGVMVCPEGRTEDGFETQFGVNHLGHFLFTCLLLPRIIRSAPARIVIVSSVGHLWGDINFEDLNLEKAYAPFKAYCQSKLANVLFCKELARRLQDNGVTTYSLHPGAVDTELQRHLDDTYFRGANMVGGVLAKLFLKKPEDGALTSIYCSVDEKLVTETGLYYSDCKEKQPSAKARDPETARKLWEVSANLVGLGDWDPFTAPDIVSPPQPK